MDITLTNLERIALGIGAGLLLEYDGGKLLLDCGYDDSQPFGGTWSSLGIPAAAIHAVILSHGHLGHSGLLPVLVREGFRGKVYCTDECSSVATLGMREAALSQEPKQYWALREPRLAPEPVYRESEVDACEPFFMRCRCREPVAIDEYATAEFFEAGHGPGSALVKIELRREDRRVKLLYVGDVGAAGNDLGSGPVIDDAYDHLFLPAFTATRHEAGKMQEKLAAIIKRACKAGGNVLIPVSSIDRRDAILQMIQNISEDPEMPSVFVFLDSPVAGKQCEEFPLKRGASEVYRCLRAMDTDESSKMLNSITGTVVIIAGSGKGGYGRIGFHLKKNAARPESAIVLFGAQPDRVLDQALRGGKTLPVFGEEVEVKARVYRLEDPFVHLDADAVIQWLGRVRSQPHVHITHGGQQARAKFARTLRKCGVQNVHVPTPGERIAL